MRYCLQSDHDVAWIVFFLLSFFSAAIQYLGEPLWNINKLRFSLFPLFMSLATRSLRGKRKKKKKTKCTSQSAACKFPEPEEIFQSDESPRRLTNCERPRCDRWISGLPGRPPRPSRTLAQPPIFSDSRKTAEIITTPFNWRIKMRQ